ncbi:protein of unknown function [Taphrina deformans PYCC 5710]|uniref:LysM domain-containing protein n=1 Tax=Taphrina deformans (strain PYCC 5710 / ATCC 11124 / CBS 356.35 / IMI 108563 / JCM 9778 / NBRC 8474) TaxID=1097556 RepID=R4XFI6_TAPDE|nr:protein of unknown function [Taphrina deformans PYCC 5710]|eukprot:CCG84438.1 protein of unknown function [Taphrina deformans PYCC 5710]
MEKKKTTTTTTTPARSCVSCYTYDDSSKGTTPTPCCGRFVCGPCGRANPRLVETCILCQLPIPRDLGGDDGDGDELPGYDASLPRYAATDAPDTPEKDPSCGVVEGGGSATATDAWSVGKEAGVHHFVRKEDSVGSLSLAYDVAPSVIRKANHLFADALLQGRSFILVPGATRSLSDRPGEEDVRKGKLKRFMVQVKCTDYDMAKTYMTECDYSVADAVERYLADSQWTRAHARDVNHTGPATRR